MNNENISNDSINSKKRLDLINQDLFDKKSKNNKQISKLRDLNKTVVEFKWGFQRVPKYITKTKRKKLKIKLFYFNNKSPRSHLVDLVSKLHKKIPSHPLNSKFLIPVFWFISSKLMSQY